MNDITVEELKQKLSDNAEFIFIDVREPVEYEQFNLGAELIPLSSLMAEVHRFEDDRNKEIVVHCRSGQRSAMAKHILQQEGFTNVRNLLGGVLAWAEMEK